MSHWMRQPDAVLENWLAYWVSVRMEGSDNNTIDSATYAITVITTELERRKADRQLWHFFKDSGI